jgi:uncharacterized protein YndB with AHSA1/START domain
MSQPSFVYVTYIDTTAEKLWAALTSPKTTRLYWGGWSLQSPWKAGAPVRLVMESAEDSEGNPTEQGTETVGVRGEVLEFEPPSRLSYSWQVQLVPGMKQEPPSRVRFELQPIGDVVKLTLTHDGFTPGGQTVEGSRSGWPVILSSLKTYLERGIVLDITGPERDEAARSSGI